MKEYFELLLRIPLFSGLSADELNSVIVELSPVIKRYEKGKIIITQGEQNHRIGIVLSGSITASKNSSEGTALTVSEIGECGLFGDVLSGSTFDSPVTVTANENTVVMFVLFDRLVSARSESQEAVQKIIRNLIEIISNKYFELERRLSLLSCGKLRKRIESYLCGCASLSKSLSFFAPHTRETQSNYLGCERSALSRELARMKKEGIIDYKRNFFLIKDPDSIGLNVKELKK